MSLTTNVGAETTGGTFNCDRCGRQLIASLCFAFKAPGRGSPADGLSLQQGVIKCFRCALRHRPMLKRSLVAALVVGTVLTALNQGDTLLAGHWSNALYWKIPLTYCVPLMVATYGALTNSRK